MGIGGTSKAEEPKQVGQHGEGLKLSALVNRRHPHNYGFVVVGSGCRWIFGWNVDRKLNCRIQRVPQVELREQKEIAAQNDERGVQREARARSWEDVSVIIGEPRRCRSFLGETQTSSKIPLASFEEWTKMTIDINKPGDKVHTEHGDLILDPAHANNLYLHGLRLPSGSKSRREFAFSYNLLNVKTGRDRDTVANAWTEASKVADIWHAALLAERDADKSVLLQEYMSLLQHKLHAAADVYSIGDLMTPEITNLVGSYMQKMAKDKSLFYHCSSDSQASDLSTFVTSRSSLSKYRAPS